MGGDGGSIPGRADVVRTAGMRFARNLGGMGYLPNTQVHAGSEKYKSLEEKQLRWTTCALTQEPLRPPLTACRLGQIYNKEAILRRFMDRKTVPFPSNISHVESLKDLRDLRVEFDSKSGRIVCPILKLEFNSGIKGVLLWSCGCVVSAKAFEQLTSPPNAGTSSDSMSKTPLLCPVCDSPYTPDDVVRLVPDLSELSDIRDKIMQRKAKEKHEKKSRKVLQSKEAAADPVTVTAKRIMNVPDTGEALSKRQKVQGMIQAVE